MGGKATSLLLALVLCGWIAGTSGTPTPGAAVDRLFTALSRADCETFASLFSEDGSLMYLFGSPPITGRQNILAACTIGYQDVLASASNYSALVTSGEFAAAVEWWGLTFTKEKQFKTPHGLEYFILNNATGLLDLVVNFEPQNQPNDTATAKRMHAVWQAIEAKDCNSFANLFAEHGNWTDGYGFGPTISGRAAIKAGCQANNRNLQAIHFAPSSIIVTGNGAMAFVNTAVVPSGGPIPVILLWSYHVFVFDAAHDLLDFTSFDQPTRSINTDDRY